MSSDASEFEESIQDIPKPLPKSIRDELYANISALPQNKRIPYLEMIYSKSEALMATKITGERRQLVVSLKAHIGNALSKYKIGY